MTTLILNNYISFDNPQKLLRKKNCNAFSLTKGAEYDSDVQRFQLKFKIHLIEIFL